MPNPIPLQHGKYYHVYNRGNNRENVFIEERNYHYFLELYVKYVVPIANTFAYCLLRNHFHFLLRVKDLTGLKSPASIFPICSTPIPRPSTRPTIAQGRYSSVPLAA